jgi:CheY-like chemotaxis protein
MLRTHSDARVLVVDDYEDNVVLLQRLLRRHGLEDVLTTTDPRTVIDHLDELNPDLVLLDLHMPHIDGHTVLRHIRTWAGPAYLPVVVLTADTSPDTLLRALDHGATDFLTKPFDATEIAIRVRNLLDARSYYLALERLAAADAARPGP